jgi:hypothetical protein
MAVLSTGAVFTFETWTLGGRLALDALREAYGRVMHLHPNEHPIIEFGVSSYEGKRGLVYNPVFKIIDWIPVNAAGMASFAPSPAPSPAPKMIAALPPERDDGPPPYEAGDPGPSDDDIPF